MLYFLLTVIAIGVLLCSDIGRMILGGAILLLLLGVVLFVGFWVVVILIGLLSNEVIRGYLVLGLGVLFFVWLIVSGLKDGKYTKKTIVNATKSIWQRIKNIKNYFGWGSWN